MNKIIFWIALWFLSLNAYADSVKYFADLRYNHVSLHVPIKGIMPLNKTAIDQPHYKFTFNDNGQITEIINHNYGQVRRHPLTHFSAHRVTIQYNKNQEVRRYFDIHNQPMLNIRGVHKEIFTLDDSGFKKQLSFFDVNNQPTHSLWNIAKYVWKQQEGLVIENRVNLDGIKQNLSPYFSFKTTAIEYDKQGNPFKLFNLNGREEVSNSQFKVAYYQDEYNKLDQHIKYSYFDEDNNVGVNPWGFSYAIKKYDNDGRLVRVDRFNHQGKFMPREAIPAPVPISKQEHEIIKQVAINYLVALQTLNPQLMAQTLHQELSKNVIRVLPNGKHQLNNTSYKRMLEHAKQWNKSGVKFPPNPNNKATIFDVYNNMAAVKLESDNWIEYLHLIKIDGRWQVKDLVWDNNNI